MFLPPIAVGLKVCQQAITQEGTRHVTLVNCMKRLEVAKLPSSPQNFTVYAILTDGLDEFDLKLVISSLADLEPFFQRRWKVTIADPLKEKWFYIEVKRLVFPTEGRYQLTLFANHDLLAQCSLEVISV